MTTTQEPLTPQERLIILNQMDDIFERLKAAQRSDVDGKFGEGVVQHAEARKGAFRLLAIDGLMGVGKTTLCDAMMTQMNRTIPGKHLVVREPVLPEWLEEFYKDPDGMAEIFQVHQGVQCITSAALALVETAYAQKPGMVVLDRSPMGNLSFALVHYLGGRISERIFKVYKATLVSAGVICMPRTVHLYAKPSLVADRISARVNKDNSDRKCESGVPLEYLQKLDAVMLLVSAYIAASKASRVDFIDWTHYGTAEKVLSRALDLKVPPQSKLLVSMADVRRATTQMGLLRLVGLHPLPSGPPVYGKAAPMNMAQVIRGSEVETTTTEIYVPA